MPPRWFYPVLAACVVMLTLAGVVAAMSIASAFRWELAEGEVIVDTWYGEVCIYNVSPYWKYGSPIVCPRHWEPEPEPVAKADFSRVSGGSSTTAPPDPFDDLERELGITGDTSR
jgi:hypothetical protein